MAPDNGDQGNQPWPPAPPPQSQGSPWGQSSEQSTPDPADNEPEEATVARPVPPSSTSPGQEDAPTTWHGQFQPPAEAVGAPEQAAPETPPAQAPPAESAPDAPSSDDERTQAFSRSDLRFDQPAPVPTQQMPAFPPPPPGVPYQPPPAPPAYPPPAPPPQQGYPAAPYRPEPQPYQPAPPGWPQQPPAPGYGPPAYQPEPSWSQPQQPLPSQQPYGAPPSGYGQYGPYGQQPQPYPPYPPGPPKKRHVGLWIGVAVVVVIAALAIVAFVAKPGFLGFKKVLDHTAVEQTIEKGGYTNVRCNDGKNPTVKKGKTFTCTADGGKKVTVTITSSSGNYAWSPAS